MKVAILIYRQIEHMYFSKIVEYANKENIKVDILLLQSEFVNSDKEYKSYQKPTIKKSPHSSNKSFILNSKTKATNIIIKSKYDYFFSLHPVSNEHFHVDDVFLKKINMKWCIFMRGQDLFYELGKIYSKENFIYQPIFFSISAHQFQTGKQYIKKFKPKSLKFFKTNKIRLIHCGLTMLNKYSEKKYLYFKKIKKKLKFNKTILYLPCEVSENPKNFYLNNNLHAYKFYDVKNFYRGDNFLIKFIKTFIKKLFIYISILIFKTSRDIYFKKNREEDILKSLFEFCKIKKYNLVIKSRKKSLLSKCYDKYSDLHIVDDHSIQNPNLIQQMINKSILTIGNSSSAVYEVVFNKKKFVNISTSSFLLKEKSELFFYDYKKGSMYNFPGVTENLTVNNFIKKISNKKFEFDMKIRKRELVKYKIKFLGVDDQFNAFKVFNNLYKINKNRNAQ